MVDDEQLRKQVENEVLDMLNNVKKMDDNNGKVISQQLKIKLNKIHDLIGDDE